MRYVLEDMCFNKFSSKQLINKETEFLSILGCEIDQPYTLEFMLLFYKLIRLYVQ
jgi:hypothetical protein